MEKLLSKLSALAAKTLFTDADMMSALETVGDVVDRFGDKEITPVETEGKPVTPKEPLMQSDIRALSQVEFAKKYTVIEMRKFAKSIDVPVKGLREKAIVEKLYAAILGAPVLDEKETG